MRTQLFGACERENRFYITVYFALEENSIFSVMISWVRAEYDVLSSELRKS